MKCLCGIVAFVSVLGASDARAETLTLRAAIATARVRAAEMRAANARLAAADAEADAALAGYLPSLSGQASAGRTLARSVQEVPGLPDARAVTGQQRFAASAALRWTPFDFGQTPNIVGAARAEARAAMYRARATYNDTARAVASTYLSVVYDELLVDNANASVQIRDRHAAIVRGQVASGVRTNVDEGRAQVELEVARLEQTTTVRQSAQDKARLATILLLPVTTAFQLARPALPNVAFDAGRSAGTALERRPEVRAAANGVVAREDALAATKLARLPTVGTSVDVTDTVYSGDPLLPPGARSLSAFVTLSVPVFDWHVWGRVPVAEGELALAEADRVGTAARVQGEAAIAAQGLRAARSVFEQSRSIRDLAGATLAVMEARFQAGLATTTDLFDAAARDADARRGEIRAELDLSLATVDALAATGRMAELER